jgi:outer membrane usher protein FimD/PapC
MNTGIGALSFDITQSRLKSDTLDEKGQSYRATFNRMFTDTQTSIVLAAYRYSTKGYYNLNDALYAVDQEKNRNSYTLWRQKNGMTFTVNQNLPDGWGGFYLSGGSPITGTVRAPRSSISLATTICSAASRGPPARSAFIRRTAPATVATIASR